MPPTPAPRDDGPPAHDDATPADVRGLIDFLNSRESAKRPERFDTPDHAERFLALCDLGDDRRSLSAADVTRLRRLRDALVDAVENPSAAAAWDAVNELTTTVPIHVRMSAGPAVGLGAARDNPADAVIAALMAQVMSATQSGRWDRLGACARCRRVFYDSTRSHTRRWCSYATCGNRANVASHRRRTRPS